MTTDDLIKQWLQVRKGDVLPYKGWRNTVYRKHLVSYFAKLGYKRGAEIGVAEGYFSQRMLNKIPDLELFSIDPYIAYSRVGQRTCNARRREAEKRLGAYPGSTLMVMTGDEAAKEFEDESLDFVYIDGDHVFDSVMVDIITWSRKVRPGGIVSGHDFFPFWSAGVMDAVYAYTRAHNISDWYVTHEREASWFWVKK